MSINQWSDQNPDEYRSILGYVRSSSENLESYQSETSDQIYRKKRDTLPTSWGKHSLILNLKKTIKSTNYVIG
jgi:hypothetical protein